jgi:hypothetical protein
MDFKNPQMATLSAELRVFAARIGSLRSILLHLLLLAAFGIWIPRSKGVDFLDPQVLAAYACLGLIFSGPAAAQSFDPQPNEGVPPSFPIAKARVFIGVLYGEAVVAALTGAGIATVYYFNHGGYIPTPDWLNLARSAMLGLGAAALIASMAAWLAVKFSRRTSTIVMRLVFFALLILFFYKGQWLPEAGLGAAAACLAIAGLFIELLRKACQSSPSPIT